MAKRAPQGSGTIRERKDKKGNPTGKWEARYTTGRDVNGKQIQRSIYGSSQKEVLDKLQKAHAEIKGGDYVEPSKMTVKEWLDIWLKTYIGNVKQTTHRAYTDHVNGHIVPHIGNVPLQKLKAHTIQELYNTLSKSGRRLQKGQKKEAPAGLSAKTIKNVHMVLRRALEQAHFLRYIKSNPTTSCVLPRNEKKDMQILQGVQIPQFINAIENHRYKALFTTMLFTGIRRGEALGLTWDNIDFARRTILVGKQLQRERVKGGKLQLVPLKNDKQRWLSPPDTVFSILSEHKCKQAERQLLVGQLWTNSNLVFTNDTGGGLDGDALYTAYKKMLSDNNLPSIRLHDLRHTAATLMIQNGDDIKTIQDALGHHSAGFTLDTYGHVTDQMKQASASRMEAYIQSIKTS